MAPCIFVTNTHRLAHQILRRADVTLVKFKCLKPDHKKGLLLKLFIRFPGMIGILGVLVDIFLVE